MAKIGAEDIELIKVFDFCRFHKLDDFIFHVAGERVCSPQAGTFLKRKGTKAGISDILILKPSNGFHGGAIELKVKGGKVSPAQKLFLDVMELNGYLTKVCWSSDEAIDTICAYLNITPQHKLRHEPESDFLGEF